MGTEVTLSVPDWFMDQLARMAGLKFAPIDLVTHWDGLCDVDRGDLERAVSIAIRECASFPSPAALREIAARTAAPIGPDEDRSRPLAEPVTLRFELGQRDLQVTREWKFFCAGCKDTGWASFHCGTNGAVTCGRDFEHGPHEYVNHCACWDSNPAVLKKRARSAQQAAQRSAKRGE